MQRNIRPASTHLSDEEASASEIQSDDTPMSTASPRRQQNDEEESTSSLDNDHNSANEDENSAQQSIGNVSFSALKQAQASLSRKRKREEDTSADRETKLNLLKERLQRIKKENAGVKKGSDRTQHRKSKDVQRDVKTSSDNHHEADSEDDDESSESGAEDDNSGQRRSKHAPATQSSKHQVTRKRQVVDVPKRITRDPRFDAVRQRPGTATGNEEKAYSFLRDYQKSEMQELKSAMKSAKSDEDKQTLRRKLNSMENQVKTRDAKERERDVVRKYRREEAEQVRQGKNPYFLKRGEIKERALVEKFQGMKGKDREKLLERRRLKESQKEKRRMPSSRRGVPAG